MPVLYRKLVLQPIIFDRIFHKMEKPILVWNAFEVLKVSNRPPFFHKDPLI
jgi:hypothetical protein